MNRPKRLLICAAALAAISLSISPAGAEDITVDSGTATLYTQNGTFSYGGESYQWTEGSGNVLILNGGTVSIHAQDSNAINGVIQALTGNLTTTGSGNNSRRTTLNIGAGSVIAEAVNIDLDRFSCFNISNGGILNIDSADSFGTYSYLALKDGGIINANGGADGITVIIQGTGGTLNITNGTLTLNSVSYSPGSIAAEVAVNTAAGSTLAVSSGELYINNNDNLQGRLELSSSGTINVQDTNFSGSYTQTSGNLNVSSSEFTLASGSSITGGNVSLSNGSDLNLQNGEETSAAITAGAGDSINLSQNSSLSIVGGAISAETSLNVDSGSGVNVSGGSVILDINDNDNYLGSLSLSAGTVNILNKEFTTSDTVTFGITNGVLNLNSSKLSINTADSSIAGGTINLQNTSGLTLNNGQTSTVSLGTDSTANTIDITGNSTLNMTGGQINEASVVNIAGGSSLDVNNSGAVVSIDNNDTWNGLLELLNGSVSIKDKNADASAGQVFVQTGGKSDIINSNITLNTEDSYITGGTVNVSGSSTINISNGLENAASLNMTGVNNFNIDNSSSFVVNSGSINAESNVNIASGAVLNLKNGAVLSLEDTDTWNGTLISDGGLNLTDMNIVTDSNRIYQQAVDSTNSVLNLDNTSLTLNEGSFTNGGTINLSNSSNITYQNNRNNYANINTDAETESTLTVANDTILTLQGGTITENAILDIDGHLDVSGAEVVVDSLTDTLNGDLTLLRGNLTLKEIEKQTGVIQAGGIFNLDASNIKLSDADDIISAGTLNFTNNSSLTIANGISNTTDYISTDDTSNNLTIENSSNYIVRGGSITEPSHITIGAGSGLEVDGAEVTVDNATDVWKGALSLKSGTINLKDFNGTNAISTDSSKTFNQIAGDLNIENSELTLNSGSVISSGQISLSDDSVLYFNNGVQNTASVTANDSTSNDLVLAGNSILTLLGGTINSAAYVDINSGSHLNIGGNNANITISGEDNWAGQLSLSNGVLNINDGFHSTDENKTFAQTGGTLNLNGTSLQLNTDASYINQGTVNLSNNSMLTFDNGRGDNTASITTTDTSFNNLIVYENSDLTLVGGTINKEASVTIDYGSNVFVKSAALSLNNTDTWSGGVTLTGGSVTLTDGLNAVTNANKTYVQSGGSLFVNNASLTLDTAESYITSGIGYLQNGGSLTIANGLDSNSMELYANDNSASSLDIIENSVLTLTDGVVDTASRVNIDDDSKLNITGATVNIDGVSGDVWNGEIGINSGTLNVSNTNLDNGILRAERGNITLGTNSKLHLAAGSIISATMRTIIQDTGELHITGGTAAMNNGDTWIGDIYLTGGSLSYTSLTENGNIYADGGSLSVYRTSGRGTLNIDGDSYINAATEVSLTGSATFEITDGSVYFNAGDTWADNTLVTLDGGGLFDYSDLTTGGRLQAASGNVDVHSGILNFTNSMTYIAEEVELNLDEGATINITNNNAASGGVTINDGGAEGTNDSWNGNVQLSGGTFNLTGYDKNTTANSTYTQSDGTLNLNNGANLTLNEGSQINGSSAVVNFASSGNTSSLTFANNTENSAILSTSGRGDSFALSNNSEFTHVRGTIEEADTVNIGAGSTFNLAGTASSRLSTLYLNDGDNYSGNINLSSGYGRLYIDNIAKTNTGTLVQSSSNAVTTITGDNFVFNNAADNISGGTLNIGTSSEVADVGVSAGTIAAGADININDGSTLNISGGSVTVNSGDTWKGDVNQTSGTLIYDGLTSNGGLNSTGGNFNLVGNAVLRLGDASNISSATKVSIGSNAEIDITNGTSLSLDSEDEWFGHIHNNDGTLNADSVNKAEGSSYIQEGADSVLNVTGTGFNLSGANDEISAGRLNIGDESGTLSDFTISSGTVADGVTVNVFDNAELIIDGGELTLSDTDTVNGSLELRDGLLTLEDWILNAGYVQTGGLLDMYGSELHITDSGSSISGAVHLNDNSLLDLSASSDSELEIQTDGSANRVNIGAGNITVNKQTSIDNNASVNISGGANLNIASGTVNLNTGDSWNGNINNNANLNINNISKTGGFTQYDSRASVNITGQGFDLNSVGDEISAGQINIGSDSQTGELGISIGTVGEEASINLKDGSSIEVDGGTLTLNDNDIWNGDIVASAGTINILSPIEKEGSFSLNGATTNIYSDFTFNGNDSLTSGILNTYGDLNFENGAEAASEVALTISRNTTVSIDNSSTLNIDSNDYWYGNINNSGILNLSINKNTDSSSVYSQSGGILNISDSANLTLAEGSSVTNNGVVNLSEASGITFNNNSENSAVINTTDNTANQIGVAEGASLGLGNGTNINSEALVNFSGDVSISGGNLVLNTGDILTGDLTNTGANVVFDGVTKSGSYIQNNDDALLSILADLTLGSSDSVTAGGLNIEGADLTIDGLSITDNINVTINADGQLTIASGSSAYLSSEDTINGSIDNSGSLTVKDITLGNSYSHNNAELIMDNSRFNAQSGAVDGGSITLNNNSVLNISNGESNSFGVITDSTNNQLGITNGSKVELASGNILEETILNLSEGSKLTIGNASVAINDKGVSADTWEGTIELDNANSTLELVDYTSHVGELIAEQGNLKLSGNTVISLTDGSIAEAVALDIGTDAKLYLSGASLNLDSADNWGGTIIMNNESSSLTLKDVVTDDASNLVAEKGDLTLTNSTLNLTGTSQIRSEVNVNIESDSTVNITGGNVILDGETDTWEGKLTISSGNLTLDDMVKEESGIFQQTGGTTTILGTSFDMNNSADYIQSGTLIVGDGLNEALITVSEGKIYDGATLVIKDKGEVNIVNNGTGGESGSGSGGIDWSGHVQVDGGKLTIDETTKTGTLSQTGGEIVITGAFDLNNAGDRLSGGSLRVEDDLSVSSGRIEAGNNINITEDGQITVNGGSVTVNGGDIWNGLIEVTDGTLAVDGLNGEFAFSQSGGDTSLTNSSDFSLKSGSVITGGGLNLNNSTLSSLTGTSINGTEVNLANNSGLTISNGTQNSIGFSSDNSSNKVTLTDNSGLTLNSGTIREETVLDIQSGTSLNIANDSSVTLDSNSGTADNWNGEITLVNDNSTLILKDYTKEGTSQLNAERGNFVLDGTTLLTLTDGTIAQGVKLSINEDARLNLSGASLTLDNADTWLGTIGMDNAGSTLTLEGMEIDDNANLIASTGNLVLDDTVLTIGGSSNISNDVNLNIDADSVVNFTGGSLNINDGDIWNGQVNNLGGTLTIDKNTTNKTGSLVQSTNTSQTIILGNSFDLNNALDNISAGRLTVGNGVDNTLLTVSDGTIGVDAIFDITLNSDISVAGGNVTLNENDVYLGDVTVNDGNLILDGVNKTGSLEQSGGSITIASDFVMNNALDSLTGGNLNISKDSVLTIEQGKIDSGSKISMGQNSVIKVNSGELTLNNNDIWSSEVNVSGGTLNIYNPHKTGSLVQTSGVTNILQDFTLNNSADSVTGGRLSIADGADLTIANGDITSDAAIELLGGSELSVNGGDVVLNRDNDIWNGLVSHNGGNLTISGYDTTNKNGAIQSANGSLNIQNGHLTIANGSSIGNNTALDINAGTELDITGGTVNINNNDTWNGDVVLSNGSLELSGVDKTTGSNSSFIQDGGSLELKDSSLALNDANSGIANGQVSLNDSDLTINNGTIVNSDVSLSDSSGLNISNGASNSANITTDNSSNNISISGNGTEFDITGGTISQGANVNIGGGTTVNIVGGGANVTLDGETDTWEGKLTISSGNLTLDDMVKEESGIFQQTGGTTTILGTSFDMNNSADYIQSGTLIVGDGLNEALITVSEGKIYDDATLVIKDKGEVNIVNNGTGGESGSGSGGVDWSGHVQVDGGKLTIDETTKTGTLSQTGGEIVITGAFDLNNAGDRLSGGSLRVEDDLSVSSGRIEAGNNINITEDGQITVNGGSVTVNGGDIWNGLIEVTDGNLIADGANKNGILNQTGGKTVVAGNFDLNNTSDLISGGELEIQNGTLTISQGTVTANTDVNINTNGDISVTGGNLSLDDGDIWLGDVSVSGGNLVVSEITDKIGSLTQTAGDITIAGDFDLNNRNDLISGGNITISSNSELTVSNGDITSGANININAGSGMTIAGGNVQIDSGDNWNGDVSLSGGNLALSADKETSTDSGFVQTGGTLDLNADLTVNNGSSITGDSIVNITGGNLVFNNNSQNEGSITAGSGSMIGVNSGSSLNLTGGTIADDSILDFTGNLSVTGQDTVVNIGENDVWNGNLSIAGGNLNLSVDKITSQNSTYNQTGGNLNINGSSLTLNSGSSITGGDVSLDNSRLEASGSSTIANADINLGNSSSIVLDNGKNNTLSIQTDTTANTIDINNGSGLTLVGGEIISETELGIYGDLNINNDAIVTVDGSDIWEGEIALDNGTLILDNVSDAGSFEAQSGTLKILGSDTTLGENLVINKGVTTIIDESSTLNISGGNVTFDANTSSADEWAGDVVMNSGSFVLTDNFIHETENGSSYIQTGGTLSINNGGALTLNDELSSITGNSSVQLGDKGTLTIANGQEHTAELITSGNSNFNLTNDSSLTTAGNTNIAASTNVNIASGTRLNLESGKVNLGGIGTAESSDKWNGKINLSDSGNLILSDSEIGLGTDGNIKSNNLDVNGGTLSLANTVLTIYEDTNDILKSGDIKIDNRSKVNLGSAWGNENINLQSAGLISSVNNTAEVNTLGGFIVDNVNGRADFTIDIYEDAINGTYEADSFDFTSIASTDTSKEAIINISDFNLVQSLPNATVPSQTVDLGKIFDADEIGENVKFTTTANELVTPVNTYRLFASDANDGSYLLNVTGYNKQSFRGQVVSVSQLMNQLVVNDILFDRVTLTPQTLTNSLIANRTAIEDTKTLPGYEYTRRDSGIWVKTYGNFETLRMSEDLDVENSAYGSLVGVDMGTFDIGKGWSWIPTVYMGYIGAHQSFEGVSAYENGGQIGAMGTFFNKNWIASVLGYASLYNVDMSVRGNTDQDINYYAGTAIKAAYNWRIKDHLIIQPSATVSYNFFGGQSWQSNYGQIGMATGTLNGLNVAPGVNFIWQQETWNLFATVAYVYNCVGGVTGNAGGVNLPEIWMDRGYLQYGFGVSKELTDRLSLFGQVIIRNVGRAGIGFQGELEYRF